MNETEKKVELTMSHAIRTRDLALSFAEDKIKCCTCGVYYDFDQVQAGHCFSRQWKATKFYPENVHSQCVQCNYDPGTKGRQEKHKQFIIETYGEYKLDELIDLVRFERQNPAEFRWMGDYINRCGEAYRELTKILKHKDRLVSPAIYADWRARHRFEDYSYILPF